METVAYLEVAQDYENPELQSYANISERIKLSGKAIATSLGVAATAWTGGLLTSAPAIAYGNGCCRPQPRPIFVSSCCRPRPVFVRPIVSNPCCRPVYQQPVSYPSCNSSCYSEDHGYDQGNSGSGDYQGVAFSPYADGNNLSIGDSGQTVALLQQALADLGFSVSVDGLFGHETRDAVIAYQRSQGLMVDGVAGGQTLDSLGIAGAGA